MSLQIHAPDGVPEVGQGADLAALVAESTDLEDGDILTVTSKVVSKAEGRRQRGTDREEAIEQETDRVVARRGRTRIVRNRLGLTMAAAGVDASNVEAGWILLLPRDPDASARRIRSDLLERTGHNVAVVVTDTAGRAWRTGQTDIAIGTAGLVVTESYAGREDGYGNPLLVTDLAVADELSGAAELVQGKLSGRPFAVVRGRADLVLPAGDHGSGAGVLLRAEGEDLFGYGAREAVVAAAAGGPREPFGTAAEVDELADALSRVLGNRGEDLIQVQSPSSLTVRDVPTDRVGLTGLLGLVAFVHGWDRADDPDDTEDNDSAIRLRFVRTTP